MAMCVVDAFEVIDVQHQQQSRLTGACHAVDLARNGHLELAAIGQTGQGITAGDVAQAIEHGLQSGQRGQ